MFFERIDPDPGLQHIIDCYWIIENRDAASKQQKIIPDGFTEIIFHFEDPYCINTGKEWQVQSKNLLGGQIRKYFLLENTGPAGILGIKFKPASLTRLYNLDMHEFTDKVVDISKIPNLTVLIDIVHSTNDHYGRINLLNKYFTRLDPVKSWQESTIDNAINLIFKRHGMLTINEICESTRIGERQLQNIFKKNIGLSPKFFCRIIRFNYIFQLVEKKEQSWTSLAYEAAYYDQSHFIKNFRRFTGESPSAYSFDEENMANFFLKKQ